jgi:hypothetical protein
MNLGSTELLILLLVIGLVVGPVLAIVLIVSRSSKQGKVVYVSPTPGAPPVAVQPDGWYPDPTGRHQLRWLRTGRWTSNVADGDVLGDDPV